MSRAADLARLQRQREMMVARRAQSRAEAREIAEGVAETVALSRARGSAIASPPSARGGREKPYRGQPGLDWLAMKGRLSAAQKSAGERYGALYRRVSGPARIGSSLAIAPDAGEGAALPELLSRAEASAQAAAKLSALRAKLSHHPALVGVCDMVCGQELTPREAASGEREAGRLEAVLGVALDLLAQA